MAIALHEISKQIFQKINKLISNPDIQNGKKIMDERIFLLLF